MKKFASFVLALVLLLSVGATSALASKPSAKLYSGGGQYVKRGKTAYFKYKLNSGSYTKKSGKYRSAFASYYCYRTSSGKIYAKKEIYFTGKFNYQLKWKVPNSVPKGKYVNLYGTLYKSGYYWYASTAKTARFYVY